MNTTKRFTAFSFATNQKSMRHTAKPTHTSVASTVDVTPWDKRHGRNWDNRGEEVLPARGHRNHQPMNGA
jgi:hypothetical protein